MTVFKLQHFYFRNWHSSDRESLLRLVGKTTPPESWNGQLAPCGWRAEPAQPQVKAHPRGSVALRGAGPGPTVAEVSWAPTPAGWAVWN